MDQTILSGLFALGGAVIGGGVTIIATIISNRKQVNLELKKQRIEFFNAKKIALENFSNEVSSFMMSPDNALRIGKIHSLFFLIAHYLDDEPDFEKLRISFSEIVDYIDEHNINLENTNIPKLTDLCTEILMLLKDKLCKIMKELNKEMTV